MKPPFSVTDAPRMFAQPEYYLSYFWPLKIDAFYPDNIFRDPTPFVLWSFLGSLVFVPVMGAAIGFYDGIFGPGTGSFLTMGFVALFGLGITRAAGNTKILNLASNLGALALFIPSGDVVWVAAGAMAVGQLIGGYLGALTGELHRRGTTQTPRWSTAQQQQVFSLATELAAAHEAAFLQFCQATHDTVG